MREVSRNEHVNEVQVSVVPPLIRDARGLVQSSSCLVRVDIVPIDDGENYKIDATILEQGPSSTVMDR